MFGPGRSRQEQSDRREPVPAEHESLTLKNVQAAVSGRLRVSGATTSRGSTSFPARLPEFGTVYHYFQAWQNSAVWVHLHRVVYEQARRHTGRAACPSVVIMDGQSVKTTERGGARGFYAHKRVKGPKRHILVDTLGLLVANRVEPADTSDRRAGALLLGGLSALFPRIRTVIADAGHESRKLARTLKQHQGWQLRMVKRRQRAFQDHGSDLDR